MPNPEDRRVKMTKKILKEALVELLKEKPVYEISIKRICENADVNRSTFYHHYQSAQELYDDIINDIKNDLNNIIYSSKEKRLIKSEIVCEILSYIEVNRELVLVVLGDNGNIGVGQRLSEIVNHFVDTDNNSELSVYCAQFISAGVAHIVWLWLNEKDHLPAASVAGLITTIICNGVSHAIAFSEEKGLFTT